MNLHDELKAFEEKIQDEVQTYFLAVADEKQMDIVMRGWNEDYADFAASMFIQIAKGLNGKAPEVATMDKALDAVFARVRAKVKTRMEEEA